MASNAERVCVLMSGGLDSAGLLWRLIHRRIRVMPLYVRCGLRWEEAELFWLRRFLRAMRSPLLEPLRIVDMPLRSVYGSHWSMGGGGIPGARSADRAVYLPGRNLLLPRAAAIVCTQRSISTMILGTLKGNPFGDATPQFFVQLARCLGQALDRPVRILTPFAHRQKAHLVREAASAPLALTFSCLNPRGHQHCGACNKCAERSRAFRAAGICDPTRYA